MKNYFIFTLVLLFLNCLACNRKPLQLGGTPSPDEASFLPDLPLPVPEVISPPFSNSALVGDPSLIPFSTTLDFSKPELFSADPAFIEATPLGARLRPLDQIDSDLTDFVKGVRNSVVWDPTTSSLQLDAGKTIGSYESRVFDAGLTTDWTHLSWRAAFPYGQPLPNNQQIETGYPAGNADMTENSLLLRFNEAEAATRFTDDSGQAHDATCTQCPSTELAFFGTNKAIKLNGETHFLALGKNPSIRGKTPFSISTWVKTSHTEAQNILQQRDVGNVTGQYVFFMTGNGQVCYVDVDSVERMRLCSVKRVNDGIWHQIGFVRQDSGGSIYIDGEVDVSITVPEVADLIALNVYIGMDHRHIDADPSFDRRYFQGWLDDLALWRRSLTPDEMKGLYLRKASTLQFAVRSCDDPFCVGEPYLGLALDERTVETPTPFNFAFQIVPQRYFQYSAQFISIKPGVTPKLMQAQVGPLHFPPLAPFIESRSAIGFQSLQSVGETLGPFNLGHITYQVSPNQADWFSYDGLSWHKVTAPNQALSAAKLNQAFPLHWTGKGEGRLYIRAFLHSHTGHEPVELRSLTLTGFKRN